MGLKSFFQRKDKDAAAAPAKSRRASQSEPAEAVQQARTRARRRLTGAVVLLGIGIIGFPLLFETQPRPIPVDIPIEIPNKDTVPALQVPAARSHAGASSAAASAVAASATPVIEETAADAGRDVAQPASAASAPVLPASRAARETKVVEKPAEKPAAKATDKTTEKVAEKAVEKSTEKAKAADDGARAKALLDGKPSADKAAEGGGRFIVQVGAFADRSAAHEVRQKVEKLGLKTYTQVVDTPSGARVRVRVGPFATREDAAQAAAKLKAAGLGAAVLTL